MYEYTVVGELALRKNEPAVLRTLETGMPTRDLKAITQENKNVKQNVVPIHNEKQEVIGVLITERDATRDVNENNKIDLLTETTEQLTETLLDIKGGNQSLSHYVNDAIIIFNNKRVAIYVNPVAKELYQKLGYKDDIVGMD